MRLRFNKEAEEKVENYKNLIKEFPFNIDNYIIELGTGKGEMISAMAGTFISEKFLGIEKYNTVLEKAIKKLNENKIDNVFLLNKNIKDIDIYLEGKAKEIWLTFSDPWPKKSHAKRRLTHSIFLEKYKSIANHNTILKLKTDNDLFFKFSLESINKNDDYELIFETDDLYKSEKIKNNFPTGYELKWLKNGKNINYLEFKLKER